MTRIWHFYKKSFSQFPSHFLISRLELATRKHCLRLSGSLVAGFFFFHFHLKPTAQHWLDGRTPDRSVPVPAQCTASICFPQSSLCHNASSFLTESHIFSVFPLKFCVICNFYPHYNNQARQTAVRSNKIYKNRIFFLFFLEIVDCFVPFYKKNLYEP